MSAPTAPSGWTLDARDCVGSTNEEAAKHAESGAAEGLIVSARQQVSGRGRRGVYAVRIGVDNRAEADIICQKLRGAGGSCVVVRNR